MPGQLPRKFFIVAFVPNANSPHNDGVGKRDDGGFALRIIKDMPIAQRRIKARAGLPY